MLYGCDANWWKHRNGVPEFNGLKLTQDRETAVRHLDVHKVKVEVGSHEILVETPGVIGDGHNSGFQAINLAVQFGASVIIGVGFDMRVDLGTHWHGRHGGALNNPRERNVIRWRMNLEKQAGILARLGVKFLNASPVSHLGVYPIVRLDEVL